MTALGAFIESQMNRVSPYPVYPRPYQPSLPMIPNMIPKYVIHSPSQTRSYDKVLLYANRQ